MEDESIRQLRDKARNGQVAEEGGEDREKRSKRLAIIIGAVLLGLFVLYTAFGYLAAPSIIGSQLKSSLSSALDRPVQVGRVSFNPFTLDMAVQEVGVARKDAEGALLSLEELHVNLDHFSLIEWALVLGELRLVRPEARLVYREDGTYNFSDLVSGRPEDGGEEREGGLFPVVLRSFAIQGGEVVFEDRALDKTHRIEKLDLNVPFASTLPEDKEEPVKPTLSAVINGTPVSLTGKALPFAEPLRAEFNFRIEGSDLTHYWAYAPLPEVVGLKSGTLSCDASLVFEQGENILPRLYVGGEYSLENVALTGRENEEILAFELLRAEIREVGVFDRAIRADALELRSPILALTRLEDGGIDWRDYLPLARGGETAANAIRAGDAEKQDVEAAVHLQADRLRVTGGRLKFTDRAVAGGFAYELSPIDLEAENINTADEAPAKLEASFGGQGNATLAVNATFGVLPLVARGGVEISGLSPGDFRAYYARALPLELRSGVLRGRFSFSVPEGEAGRSSIGSFDLELSDFAAASEGAEEPQIEVSSLTAAGGPLEPAARRLVVREVEARNAKLTLKRGQDGEIGLLAAFAGGEERPPAQGNATEAESWDLLVDKAGLFGARLAWVDEDAPRPGRVEIVDLSGELTDFRLEQGREMPLIFSGRLESGGKLRFNGALAMPAKVEGDLELDELALAPAGMYLPAASIMHVAGGTLSASGRLVFDAGADRPLGFKGGAGLTKLSLTEGAEGEEFLSLAALEISELDVQGAPFAVAVGSVNTSGLQAAYRVTDEGSNLGGILQGFGEKEEKDEQKGGDALESLTVSTFRIEDGLLEYLDTSVKPVFDMRLSELNLKVDGVALSPEKKSNFTLAARINDSAPLKAEGSLNVMQATAESDFAVDIENMDLPQLSPYSSKYVGYPISKGKLFADMSYTLRDMVLEGRNRLRIEQIELGDKVESEAASDVPVEMGIALLEDGSGTINLDVPVSGRIDDPQFRLGKVIFKATMSMFGSIVTAPFSFLGAIFGGEQAPENVGLLEFEPGSARLSPAHARKLGTVAQAMRERPRIDLEIAGYAGPGADAEALKQEKVRDFLRRSKRLELEKRGRAPDEDEKLEILPQEYDKYLRMAFERVTEKDAGDRSARKLEELLAQYAAVSDQELRELARRRGRNVRDHLMEQEGIEQDRIYMIEHDALAAPEKEGVSAARVDLGLNR